MSTDFAPGSRIGDYVLDAPIGSGSFGAVWRGHALSSGQVVAVKLLTTGGFGSAENAILRADVEVLAAAAAKNSRHVVGVLGGGSDPVPYIVMEFIEGTDLQARLAAQGNLSFQETIDVALAISDAVRALYDAGIIHRDIKPANVLIDPEGVIKLADFGIAKIVGYMTLTMTGQTAMTMAYAAPELWDEKGILGGPSNKSDLYAMGVLLYQCLAGALPFVGNYGALYRAHTEQSPDFAALPADTPPSLRNLIRRCMNKPPGDRPRDAAECIAMLRRAEAELASTSGPPTHEPAQFGPWIRDSLHDSQPWTWRCHHEATGEHATVEVHFADSLDYGTGLRRAVEASAMLTPLGAERLLGTNRLLLHPEEAWQAAPEGRFQFWVAREDAASRAADSVNVALLRVAVGQLASLMSAATAQRLSVVSPLSDLTVLTDGAIYLRRPGLDEAGTDPGESAMAMLRRLPLDAGARGMLASAPDFEVLVEIAGPLTQRKVDATTVAGAPDPEATALMERPPTARVVPPEEATYVPARPAVEPGGDATQFAGMHASGPFAEAAATPVRPTPAPPRPTRKPAATTPRSKFPLLPAAAGVSALAAAAVAAFLVLGNSGGDGGSSVTPTVQAAAAATPAATAIPLAALAAPAAAGTAATTDALLFMTDRDGHEEIYVMNPDGSSQTRLTFSARGNRLPEATKDGTRVAFVSERDGGSELYLMNGDGSNQKLLTTTDGIKLEPSFSPDGKRLIFEVKRGDVFDLYVMNADGTGLVNLTNTAAADIDPSWAPVGDRIVFGSDRDGNMDIYVSAPDGTGARRVHANAGFEAEPDWSPDGKRIVFQSNRGGNFDLYIINDDGTGLVRLTTDQRDEFDAAWSPDGKTIAYTLIAGVTSEVYVVNVDGSQPKAVTNHASNDFKPGWTTVRRP